MNIQDMLFEFLGGQEFSFGLNFMEMDYKKLPVITYALF